MNAKLAQIAGANEVLEKPFEIFADIGEAQKSYRTLNTVYSKRYGVCSVLSSNITPVNGLMIYNATASVDILVNVDHADLAGEDLGEFSEVKQTRRILDEVAAESSATPTPFVEGVLEEGGKTYTVVPVYTLSTAGTYAVETSEMGKIVPMTFSVDVSVVESGINSAAITLTIDGNTVPASQIAEDMISSAEGQTRMGAEKSTFNVQEARYSLSFVTPLTSSAFCQTLLRVLHEGTTATVYSVNVNYADEISFDHSMIITSVRLTGQIPNNAGLNVEMSEADILPD